MVMFVERIGTLQGRWEQVFNFWAMRATKLVLYDEAVKMDLGDKAASFLEIIEVSDNVADIVFAVVWNSVPNALS